MDTGDKPAGRKHAGHHLAVLASTLIAADTFFLLLTLGIVLTHSALNASGLRHLLSDTPFPLVVYVLWLIGVAGSAAAVLSIILYDFRERWFWRWMLVGSLAWLAFPPVHALIGLVALVLLLRNRSAFPKHLEPEPLQA